MLKIGITGKVNEVNRRPPRFGVYTGESGQPLEIAESDSPRKADEFSVRH